ncbi:hypothetical protein [Cupriavidus pauculus]|uniref:hypothetical protein n=1 Tax=Cupriavidus pauculus TaxID=82633 RepID=UPI001D0C2549|nr:hypothetical protein [Cupriavidus pauculus]
MLESAFDVTMRERWRMRAGRFLAALVIAVPLFFMALSVTEVYGIDAPPLALAMLGCLAGGGMLLISRAFVERKGRLLILICSACGIGLASLVPVVHDRYPEVKLIATGEHAALSDGTEVWAPDVVPGRVYFEGPGWERRENSVVSYAGQPNVAVLKGLWNAGDIVRLMKHPHSGIAIVRIGDTEQRIDLYAPGQATASFELPAPGVNRFSVSRQLARLLVVFLAAAFGAVLGRWTAPGPVFLSAAAILGTAAALIVSDTSFPGDLELLAYGTGSLSRLEVDTGDGSFPFPIHDRHDRSSVEVSLPRSGQQTVRLGVAAGRLRPLNPLGPDTVGGAASVRASALNLCATGAAFEVFEHVDGDGPHALHVWSNSGKVSAEHQLVLKNDPGGKRYVVVRCTWPAVSVTYSQALLAISAWSFPHGRVKSVKALDDGGNQLPLLQVSSGNPLGFSQLRKGNTGYQRIKLDRSDTGASFIQKVLATCLAFALPLVAWVAVLNVRAARRNWRPGNRMLVAWLYLAPLGWVASCALIQWPGTVAWDAYSPFIQAQTGTITLWYGVGYPMITAAVLLLADPSTIALLQCLVAALIVQFVMVHCIEGGKVTSRVAALACLGLPLTVIPFAATTYSRDALNGILLAAFGTMWTIFMWRLRSTRPIDPRSAGSVIAALAICLVLLRVDNLIPVAVLVLAIPVLVPVRRIVTTTYAVLLMLAVALANPLAERVIMGKEGFSKDEKNRYVEASLVSPLVGFLADPAGRISPETRRRLEHDLAQAVDVPESVRKWTPYNVIWWHQQIETRPAPTDALIRNMRRDLVRAILDDPMRFLEMRSSVLASTLGHRWLTASGETATHVQEIEKFVDRVWMTASVDTVAMNRFLGLNLERRLSAPLSRAVFEWYARYATTLPQFLVCLILVCLIRRLPLAGVMALALLAHAGVFFALAPADVFLYLFDMHFMGYLLVPLAALEWWQGRQAVSKKVGRRTQLSSISRYSETIALAIDDEI